MWATVLKYGRNHNRLKTLGKVCSISGPSSIGSCEVMFSVELSLNQYSALTKNRVDCRHHFRLVLPGSDKTELSFTGKIINVRIDPYVAMDKKTQNAGRWYTAKDVRSAASVSYRQLNDWDAKGLLPKSRSASSRWRRYTQRELFAISVCAEFRRQFGVPLESLQFLGKTLLHKGSDYLYAAVQMIGELEVPIFVATDLKETFIFGTAIEIANRFEHGLGREYDMPGLLLIKVNPVVSRILGCLKTPVKPEIADVVLAGVMIEILGPVRFFP